MIPWYILHFGVMVKDDDNELDEGWNGVVC